LPVNSGAATPFQRENSRDPEYESPPMAFVDTPSSVQPSAGYSEQRQGTCQTCRQDVSMDEPAIEALGCIYHTDHFQCVNCRRLLTQETFFERLGKPWCDRCLNDEVLLPRCAFCKDIIRGVRHLSLLLIYWIEMH
jgi:hypothetical protein